jgi:hypothetical protein
MMKLRVAYDREGRIIAAAEVSAESGVDSVAPREDLSVVEADVPEEFANSTFAEFVTLLRMDVQTGKLVSTRPR